MEEVKRIYYLLLHSSGLKIKDIAKELDLDKYYVADIMFSSNNHEYWYHNSSSFWYAKEGAIQIEEPQVDRLTAPLVTPKVINVSKYLQGHSSSSLRSYINNLANYRTYTDDEINELFTRYRNGDREAFDLIVKSNLKLVVSYAYFLKKDGVQIEDLIQEGNIGLIRAVELYDHSRSTSFVNYAKNWVYQTISSSTIHLPYLIRLPVNQYTLYCKVQRIKEKYEQQNGYQPSVADIDIDNDIDFERIALLNGLPDNLNDITVSFSDLDVFENDHNLISNYEIEGYNKYYVNRLLCELNGREELIVRSYYGIGIKSETLESIGESFGVSRERIRQIIARSIKDMRYMIENKTDGDTESTDALKKLRIFKSFRNVTIGDYVKLPSDGQVGKVIYIQMIPGKGMVFVLRTIDGNIYKYNKKGELITNEMILVSYLQKSPKDVPLRNSKNQESKNRQHGQIIAKIGDRIKYDDRRGTVIDKRTMGSSSRLIIEYDNGAIDNVPNDIRRYIVYK